MIKRFYYGGNSTKILRLLTDANHIMQDNEFYQLIREIPSFDLAKDLDGKVTGHEMAELIEEKPIACNIVLYRPRWPWSKVLGYYKGGKNVYLNSRRLHRSDSSILNTIIHEYIHLLDNYTDSYLGHGGNTNEGKGRTAPYKIGDLAEELYLKRKKDMLC